MIITDEKLDFCIKPLSVTEYIILYTTSFISLFFALLTANWVSNLYLLYLFIALILNPVFINTVICEISYSVLHFNMLKLRYTYIEMDSFEKADFDAEIRNYLSTKKDDR